MKQFNGRVGSDKADEIGRYYQIPQKMKRNVIANAVLSGEFAIKHHD